MNHFSSTTVLPAFSSRVFFAPMAGVSDPALRLICRQLGAGLVVTEFTSIYAITAKQQDIASFIEFSPLERPLSVQLFGSDLEKLKLAIEIVNPYFDIIDYNMGCPAPHITEQMACSALLQQPELTRKIFRTMVAAANRPVTIKIRAGVDKPDCWKTVAKIAEEEGIAMITFHPRTVKQGYSGKSNWALIKELKQLVKIPVVGNGDIETPEDAKKMLEETNCDYVMIGRAAAKNPFLFRQINELLATGKYLQISAKECLNAFFQYLQYTEQYHSITINNIKMQAMNFSKGSSGSKKLRENLLKVKTKLEIMAVMKNYYDSL